MDNIDRRLNPKGLKLYLRVRPIWETGQSIQTVTCGTISECHHEYLRICKRLDLPDHYVAEGVIRVGRRIVAEVNRRGVWVGGDPVWMPAGE